MTMKVTHHYSGDDPAMQDFVDKMNRETLRIDTTGIYEALDVALSEGNAEMHSDIKTLSVIMDGMHDSINKNLVRVNLQLSDILVRLSIIEEKLYNK